MVGKRSRGTWARAAPQKWQKRIDERQLRLQTWWISELRSYPAPPAPRPGFEPGTSGLGSARRAFIHWTTSIALVASERQPYCTSTCCHFWVPGENRRNDAELQNSGKLYCTAVDAVFDPLCFDFFLTRNMADASHSTPQRTITRPVGACRTI